MEELTEQELKAIKSLQRVAKKWPKSLWLFSASGDLCVMKNGEDGHPVNEDNKICLTGPGSGGGVDPNYHTGYTIDIQNDGGDW